MTLTYEVDLRSLYSYGQDELPCQISTSAVIVFQRSPEHTQPTNVHYLNHKIVGKNLCVRFLSHDWKMRVSTR